MARSGPVWNTTAADRDFARGMQGVHALLRNASDLCTQACAGAAAQADSPPLAARARHLACMVGGSPLKRECDDRGGRSSAEARSGHSVRCFPDGIAGRVNVGCCCPRTRSPEWDSLEACGRLRVQAVRVLCVCWLLRRQQLCVCARVCDPGDPLGTSSDACASVYVLY